MSVERVDVEPIARCWGALERAVGTVVVGQREALRLAYLTLLCRGHSLVEGVPGVAKTLLVRSLAAALGIRFGRVQFTPDLMPSDVIGTPVLDPERGAVRFRSGPLFTDLLLADEINRASAKTQAALLEAMQERSATVDGTTHPLGPHFTVFATQNPIEQEGTYPLPEAEVDRFLFKIAVEYPSEEEEHRILAMHHADDRSSASVERVLEAEVIDDLRARVQRVIVEDAVIGYVNELVRVTRRDPNLLRGASPRAGVLLLRAAKAAAALAGRDYALPEDVQDVLAATLRHRVAVEPAAELEGVGPDEAIERVRHAVAVPR